MRGWGPIVQVLKSVLNKTTYLLSFLSTPYLDGRHIESAKRVILTHVN